MKLVELNKNEFKTFVDKSEQVTFHQTKNWGVLKKSNGWHPYYVGLDNKGQIKAAALILSKEVPMIKKRIMYSPRGFIINYKDLELLRAFTREIKKFAESKNAIFVRIDPYVMYKQHDINGDLVEGGIDNSQIVDNLKELGYKHFGFNLMQEALQPRWMHVINTEGKTLDEVMAGFESKTRQIIRKNERNGIHTREIKENELPLFKEIMQQTSERRDFLDRPLSYYEEMWKAMHSDGILKIMIAYIDFDEYLENTTREKEKIENEMNDRQNKKDNNILKMNEKKFLQKQKFSKNEIERLDKEIEKIKKYQYEYGHKLNLGAILFLIYGNEVLSLFGGSLEKFMNFQSAYTLHFEGIKYAVEHGYKRYNFYGITGDFSKDNPLYGLYLFKKSFGGEVVELIGEFDLVINKFWYTMYQKVFPMYKNLKRKKKTEK